MAFVPKPQTNGCHHATTEGPLSLALTLREEGLKGIRPEAVKNTHQGVDLLPCTLPRLILAKVLDLSGAQ